MSLIGWPNYQAAMAEMLRPIELVLAGTWTDEDAVAFVKDQVCTSHLRTVGACIFYAGGTAYQLTGGHPVTGFTSEAHWVGDPDDPERYEELVAQTIAAAVAAAANGDPQGIHVMLDDLSTPDQAKVAVGLFMTDLNLARMESVSADGRPGFHPPTGLTFTTGLGDAPQEPQDATDPGPWADVARALYRALRATFEGWFR